MMQQQTPGSMFDLTGKVALLTGATRGIGRAIAEQLARAGASVVLSSEQADDSERIAREMRREGLAVTGIGCDVAYRREVDDLARAVLDLHGRVDVLVCNAGVAPHMGPIASASDADWDRTITVNLRSVLWLTSRVIPAMAERRDGSVIIVSSIAGLRGNKSIGLYGVSKAGGAQLARNLAVEWGPSNVRVNAISPGVIETEFARPMIEDARVIERRIALTPLRRVGQPHEVAGVALLLASAAGAFITGQNIVIDGGTTIGDGN
jgi:NAD(P)-dependent dehydrogenase (short-subunit alcohol dehydrogenase family)